jgi:hypothetical protein
MKITLFVLTLLTLLVTVNQASACSIDGTPYFFIKTPEVQDCYLRVLYDEVVPPGVDIIEYFENKEFIRIRYCDNLALTAQDNEMIRGVINHYTNEGRQHLVRVHFDKQSESEYIDFQREADRINADQCDCEEFDNVTRYGEWTIYQKPMVCGISGTCALIPPEGCLSRISYDLIYGRNPLLTVFLFYVLPVIVIIGLVYLFIRHRKK